MKESVFKIMLLNDLSEHPKISARPAETDCPKCECLQEDCIDYCTPSACLDVCIIDFSG
jgi:hypothetical protein